MSVEIYNNELIQLKVEVAGLSSRVAVLERTSCECKQKEAIKQAYELMVGLRQKLDSIYAEMYPDSQPPTTTSIFDKNP